MKWLLKRALCLLSLGLVHWSGRSDGGAMGDAIQCDVCGCDRYGPGWILKDRSKQVVLKYQDGDKVRLCAMPENEVPEQDAVVLGVERLDWGNSYTVEVEPEEDSDDGLREVTEDQILRKL